MFKFGKDVVFESTGIRESDVPRSLADKIIRTDIPDNKTFVVIRNPTKTGNREIKVTVELKKRMPSVLHQGKHHNGKPTTRTFGGLNI